MNLVLICKDEKKALERVKGIIKENNAQNSTTIEVIPEKNQLGIEQIRDVVERAGLTYSEGAYFIIHSFETAKELVQNTFLKTLEEHSQNVNFILLSSSQEAILPTVLSRCEIEIIASSPTPLPPETKKTIENVLLLYQKNPGRPITSYLTLSPAHKKETITDFLNNFIVYSYETLPHAKEKKELAKLARTALEAKGLIEHNYFDPETALDMVFMGRR